MYITLSNPPENWIVIFYICCTNLQYPGNVGFPWPIHNMRRLWIVPDENIGKNSEELSIRLGNLQFANFHIGGANLKKFGYPNLVVGATSNSGILKITLRNTNDRS
jgi:hypothetical protein